MGGFFGGIVLGLEVFVILFVGLVFIFIVIISFLIYSLGEGVECRGKRGVLGLGFGFFIRCLGGVDVRLDGIFCKFKFYFFDR